jgi:hypothetical protein
VVSSLQFLQLELWIHFSLPCMLHAQPSHPPWLYHPNNLWSEPDTHNCLSMQKCMNECTYEESCPAWFSHTCYILIPRSRISSTWFIQLTTYMVSK